MKTIKCIIDGKVVELTEAAAAIAKEYYGAVTEADIIKMKPQEISRPIIRPATPPVVVEGEGPVGSGRLKKALKRFQEISRPIIRPATPPVVVEGEVKKKPVKRVKK